MILSRRRLIQNFFQTPKKKPFEIIWLGGVLLCFGYVSGDNDDDDDDDDDDDGDSDDSFGSDRPFALADHVINF